MVSGLEILSSLIHSMAYFRWEMGHLACFTTGSWTMSLFIKLHHFSDRNEAVFLHHIDTTTTK